MESSTPFGLDNRDTHLLPLIVKVAEELAQHAASYAHKTGERAQGMSTGTILYDSLPRSKLIRILQRAQELIGQQLSAIRR